MAEKITILLLGIPNAIAKALEEQGLFVNNFNIVTCCKKLEVTKGNPNLVIYFGSISNNFSGIPKINIADNKTYRLGDLLLNIIRMTKEPNLYIEDISNGKYTLKPRQKLLIYKEGIEIKITDRELDALVYIFCNIGREIKREELLKNVWKYKDSLDTHTLETHIYRIRQKVEKITGDKDFLITGEFGYLLNTN